MQIVPTRLEGVYIVESSPIVDERGYFARAWCAETFAAHGLEMEVAQANMSGNNLVGTIRGMHYQLPPHAETKFVRCIRGAIYDVAVDLRSNSPTFGEWVGAELSEKNRRGLYVPRGFAHGYQTLEPASEVFYLTSASYHAPSERGVRFDDPAIGIRWPLEPTELSEKDRSWPLLDLSQTR